MRPTDICPGTLIPGYTTYSPACLRRVFEGKRVSPRLDFDYDANSLALADNINRISVSGVQEKLSAIVMNGKIMLTVTILNTPEVMKILQTC